MSESHEAPFGTNRCLWLRHSSRVEMSQTRGKKRREILCYCSRLRENYSLWWHLFCHNFRLSALRLVAPDFARIEDSGGRSSFFQEHRRKMSLIKEAIPDPPRSPVLTVTICIELLCEQLQLCCFLYEWWEHKFNYLILSIRLRQNEHIYRSLNIRGWCDKITLLCVIPREQTVNTENFT